MYNATRSVKWLLHGTLLLRVNIRYLGFRFVYQHTKRYLHAFARADNCCRIGVGTANQTRKSWPGRL